MPFAQSAGSGGGSGSTSLVYRYTVAGAVKASIDTGVDTPNAGTNSWTNADLLEVYFYIRTDEAAVFSNVKVILNNDTGANYDAIELDVANATVAGGPQNATSFLNMGCAGATAEANLFSSWYLVMPNFTGTTGFKSGVMHGGIPDSTAGNTRLDLWTANYRSTSAISRLAITPVTAAKNFAIGSQLLIYKRQT